MSESNAPILEAKELRQSYVVEGGVFAKRKRLQALREASFSLNTGRVLAIVGESGCGKSTLARILTMIEPPAGGSLTIQGVDITQASASELRGLRRQVQMVFQDPKNSLNPRKRIGAILEEPLVINQSLTRAQRQERIDAMLEQVGMDASLAHRYPHMLSGGQRQRVAIARALMLNPSILVADEPVSALDISVQAQILNLLAALQQSFRLSLLFISHDLAVVRHIADEILVMYLGRVVEAGVAADILQYPAHPYTGVLIASTPIANPGRRRDARAAILPGEPPSPLNPPPGCSFHRRCPLASDICRKEIPPLRAVNETNRRVACHHAENALQAGDSLLSD